MILSSCQGGEKNSSSTGETLYETLEVLTAQKDLLSAELAEVSDRFEEIRSVITLYHALGGGWTE